MSPNTLERIDALAAQLALSRSAAVDASLRYMLDHYRVAPAKPPPQPETARNG